jgi:hypothetical protein
VAGPLHRVQIGHRIGRDQTAAEQELALNEAEPFPMQGDAAGHALSGIDDRDVAAGAIDQNIGNSRAIRNPGFQRAIPGGLGPLDNRQPTAEAGTCQCLDDIALPVAQASGLHEKAQLLDPVVTRCPVRGWREVGAGGQWCSHDDVPLSSYGLACEPSDGTAAGCAPGIVCWPGITLLEPGIAPPKPCGL